MLYRKAVSAELLGLLTQLMEVKALESLRLVGGTALALQFGHRISIDIDMFGSHNLDDNDLTTILKTLGKVEMVGGSASINVYFINDIKTDFVNYPYPWLDPVVYYERIRMASIRDVAAMKIAAITHRGSKKDFIDLYFLLQHFSLTEIFTFYKEKITDGSEWLALRSLTYFEDADREPMPIMIHEVSWLQIKSFIDNAVREFSGV